MVDTDVYAVLAVSIHAPARGAITSFNIIEDSIMFQFTHPRGVRWDIQNERQRLVVSIHAPARGAICNSKDFYRQEWVSIHAPARGAMK